MRIDCCHCGPRGHEEFTYLGDAAPQRPKLNRSTDESWADYVYLRDNPAGPHRELWQHTAGCRAWLVITRNTRTHEILDIAPARRVAQTRAETAHE